MNGSGADRLPLWSEMPMFPLGGVLLPGMALPLRIFEPRYQVLLDTVLAHDGPQFGSVMIERGSEVGGGEVRTDVGCLARTEHIRRKRDGSATLLAVGTRRIRVLDWLPDDPFPRAQVIDAPDVPSGRPLTVRAAMKQLRSLEALTQETVDLARELGADGIFRHDLLDDEPTLRCYQLATAAPLGALDRLNILRAPDLATRVDLLGSLLDDQRLILRAELGRPL